MVYKQQNALWRVRSGEKTRQYCVPKEPKYRSLDGDGEATECMQVADQKQEINLVWPKTVQLTAL